MNWTITSRECYSNIRVHSTRRLFPILGASCCWVTRVGRQDWVDFGKWHFYPVGRHSPKVEKASRNLKSLHSWWNLSQNKEALQIHRHAGFSHQLNTVAGAFLYPLYHSGWSPPYPCQVVCSLRSGRLSTKYKRKTACHYNIYKRTFHGSLGFSEN